MAKLSPEKPPSPKISPQKTSDGKDSSIYWIGGVWVVVALMAVAILPFASRLDGVAQAIARFCGFDV